MLIITFILPMALQASLHQCHGRFINPITHVAWKTLFPLHIGGVKVSGKTDLTTPKGYDKPVCVCDRPFPRVGVPIGFWQPFRVADVTRKPFCMVNLGGVELDLGIKTPTGDIANRSAIDLGKGQQSAFYHVHWYIYPLLVWMNIITDVACLQAEDFDLLYLTELDPLWGDDEMSLWLNPEVALFSHPIMQAACAADCAAACVGKPINHMFWCAGCQGGVYPLTGNLSFHSSGVDASTLIVEKMIFKLHRELLLHATTGKHAICSRYPLPWWKKDHYKLQMVYPSVTKLKGFASNPIGRTTMPWSIGKELDPTDGDFGYLIWGRRECCIL